MELLAIVGFAAVLFVSTNIDDIFILVAFFADPAFSPRQVVIGQFLGIGALTAVSLAGSLLALVVSPEVLGLLGVLPFVLGVIMLVKLVRGTDDDDDETRPAAAGHTRVITVALVTIANGGDNIGAYVPVFATRTPMQLVVTSIVFLVLTGLMCVAAHGLVTHPRLGPKIKRVAEPLTPFVLMAVGVLIVIEAGSYRLVL